MRIVIFLFGLLLAAHAAAAEPPQLGLPLDCQPGRTCWIANYVDHDPSEGVRDYACGTATYNGAADNMHNGTDFAIRDLTAMRQGVKVLAAAAGIVAGTRDGVADVAVTSPEKTKAVADRECGNGVRIDHGDGWTTQYCHLRKGSVAVRKGERIAAGTPLGLVGLSGFTEYPHLHISVRKNDTVVDPFVGPTPGKKCGPGVAPLWRPEVMKELPYHPTSVFNVGFADEPAEAKKARMGAYDHPPSRTGKALVMWAEAFHVQKNDRFLVAIDGPGGTKIAHQASPPIPRDQARRFVFIGKRTPPEGWPAGEYQGTVQLVRPKGGDRYRVLSVVKIGFTLR